MSHIHSFNVRLNGFSHLLGHNIELQTAQKEKATKLRAHLLKTIIVMDTTLSSKLQKKRKLQN